MSDRPARTATLLSHLGRDPAGNHGVVNPPVYHASTILFPSMTAMEQARAKRYDSMTYGRGGTPTTFALEEAVATLEGGYRSIAVCSGLAANAAGLLAFVKAGDHVLMTDGVYGPARAVCDNILKRFGVETTYYDPGIGAGIAALIRDNTRVIYMETPSSITFEMQDVPAIVAAAKARGCTTLLDNTWGSPLLYQPLDHGVDVSLVAGTKYINGHSDVMIGFLICNERSFRAAKDAVTQFGYHAAPDDIYMTLRGMRTLKVRMAQHEATGLTLARWLEARPEVARVFHPGLPSHPGHEIWKRDFSGACGLFGFELKPAARPAVDAFIDGLTLFGIGASWGGFESLILLYDPPPQRVTAPWHYAGPCMRVHAGLEHPDDLIADLEAGFVRLAAG